MKATVNSVLLGLLILFGLIVAGILIVHFTSGEFTLGLITVFATVWIASQQYKKAKEREAEARLFLEKSKIYEEIVEIIFSLFAAAKGLSGNVEQEELTRKMLEIRKRLIIWGSFEAIEALDAISDVEEGEATSPELMFKKLGALYSSVRSDLSHNDPPDAGIKIALGSLVASDRKAFTEILFKNK